MGIFRYKVEYLDCSDNNKIDQGIIAASSYSEAAEALEKTIYGQDLERILLLSRISGLDENYIMIANDEVIDALEDNILY